MTDWFAFGGMFVFMAIAAILALIVAGVVLALFLALGASTLSGLGDLRSHDRGRR